MAQKPPVQEAWGGKRQPERRHNKGGGNLPLGEASHGGDGGLGNAADHLLDKVSREDLLPQCMDFGGQIADGSFVCLANRNQT